MKKSIIILGMLGFGLSYAQQDNNGKVGVNTETPSATLNVKSKTGTTNATKNLELENANSEKLVTVLDNGNVGIGTTTPTTKLELVSNAENTAFRMADGSQGEGKVLTSDENGNATWKRLFVSNMIKGTFSWAPDTAIGNIGWNTIASIIIPPGAHIIYTKLHILDSKNIPPRNKVLTQNEGAAFRTYIGLNNLGINNDDAKEAPIDGSTGFIQYIGLDLQYTNSFIYVNKTNNNQILYFNIQSDDTDIKRSKYSQENPVVYKGVEWVENYFYSIPLLD